jgi:hypothetical protein
MPQITRMRSWLKYGKGGGEQMIWGWGSVARSPDLLPAFKRDETFQPLKWIDAALRAARKQFLADGYIEGKNIASLVFVDVRAARSASPTITIVPFARRRGGMEQSLPSVGLQNCNVREISWSWWRGSNHQTVNIETKHLL